MEAPTLVSRKQFLTVFTASLLATALPVNGTEAEGTKNCPHPRDEAVLSWQQNLLAGGIARGVCIGALFPVDALKTKLQLKETASGRFCDVGSTFRGLDAALLGQIPYGMLVFGTYEVLKAELLGRLGAERRVVAWVVAALAGDALGCVWLTPSEKIKQRLQAGAAESAVEAGLGLLRGGDALAGLGSMLARDLPFRALQLPAYELAKLHYAQWAQEAWGRGMDPWEALVLGATVGVTVAAVTAPLDVVKSRVLVRGGSWLGTARELVAKGGPPALLAGVRERAGYIGLTNGVFFVVYEAVRRLMAQV